MVSWNPTVVATASPADRVVSCAVDDGVATVTVSRARKMNALSLEVFRQLNALVSQLQTDNSVRAVIVTGEGDRAFSAGADVADLVGLSSAAAYEFSASGQYVLDQLAELPKPVVAAINGVALGGGLELALACDIRITADTARFGQPEILLANTPGWGATQRLTQVVGVGRAKAMMLTGDQIDAATALHYGLVTEVTAAAELPARAMALARRLAGMAPTAVHAIKEAVHVGLAGGIQAGLRAERVGVAACCGTPEQAAAVERFTQARRRQK
jgi:enoyl-CoA hydratase